VADELWMWGKLVDELTERGGVTRNIIKKLTLHTVQNPKNKKSVFIPQ
jgi:hypothetical protein